jgi:hypothetical protein
MLIAFMVSSLSLVSSIDKPILLCAVSPAKQRAIAQDPNVQTPSNDCQKCKDLWNECKNSTLPIKDRCTACYSQNGCSYEHSGHDTGGWCVAKEGQPDWCPKFVDQYRPKDRCEHACQSSNSLRQEEDKLHPDH